MRVVVVGGGFAGMASAARLAKLGHEVTLFEAADSLGGALRTLTSEGYTWDAGPSHTQLPAVLRDLFRKSGRPLDREAELVPVEPARRHQFADGTLLDLPSGSRGAQIQAVDAALGAGAGQRWADYVHGMGGAWEVLRRDLLEQPWDRTHASAESRRLLGSRVSLRRSVRKALGRDKRLQLLATYPWESEGQDPRSVPAWAGMSTYVEQNFGTWTVVGGMGSLTPVLERRLATRGVRVHTDAAVRDLEVSGGRVRGVRLASGTEPADAVVVCIDPRRLPALAPYVGRTMPAMPPVVAHLGLEGDVPEIAHETVLHGDPMLVLRRGVAAPPGGTAWTVHARGRIGEDLVTAIARYGYRVREQVVTRVDLTPRDLVEQWRGSPYGVVWQGRRTLGDRLGTRAPVDGVLCAGAHTAPAAGLPYVGLSAALVAQVLGPA